MQQQSITDADLDQWEKEEHLYFSKIGHEDAWDTYAVAYVEMLQDLRAAEATRGNITMQFIQSVPSDYEFVDANQQMPRYATEVSSTARLETRRRHANERYNQLLLDVTEMELKMGTERWEPSSPQYQSTLRYIANRKYHRALIKVHRLVVLRLFELHKLNLSQTGKCA